MLTDAVRKFCQAGFALFEPGSHPVTLPQVKSLQDLARQSTFEQVVHSESSSSWFQLSTFAQLRYAGSEPVTPVPTATAPLVLGMLLSGEMQQFLREVLGVDAPLTCGLGTFNRYEVGCNLQRHIDKKLWGPCGSLVLGLNDTYQGGELLVYASEGEPERLRLGRGTLVLMRAGLVHEVAEVTKGLRETVTLLLRM